MNEKENPTRFPYTENDAPYLEKAFKYHAPADDVLAANILDITKQPPVDNDHVAPGCEKFSS